MDAIVVVRRTGCPWNARTATGSCSSSAAHRRLQAWVAAGVFHQVWAHGLAASDDLHGSDGDGLALEGAMTNAPRGGGGNRPHSHRPRQGRYHAPPAH